MQPRRRRRDAVLAKLLIIAKRASAFELNPVGFRDDFDGIVLGAANERLQGVLEDIE